MPRPPQGCQTEFSGTTDPSTCRPANATYLDVRQSGPDSERPHRFQPSANHECTRDTQTNCRICRHPSRARRERGPPFRNADISFSHDGTMLFLDAGSSRILTSTTRSSRRLLCYFSQRCSSGFCDSHASAETH
jgi:hypothetical protein